MCVPFSRFGIIFGEVGWVGASGNIQEGGGNEVKYVSPIPTTFPPHDDDKTDFFMKMVVVVISIKYEMLL